MCCKSRPYVLWLCVRGSHPVSPSKSASAGLVRSGRCPLIPPCITRRNYVNRLGTWNLRGINGTAKREEVVGVFREGKFKLLSLTESKLKGKGKVSLCGEAIK